MSSVVEHSSSGVRRRDASKPYVRCYVWQGYLPIEQGLPEAARQGFDGVYCDLSSREDAVMHWTPEKVQRVIELQERHGVRVIGHSDYRLTFASETPEIAAGALAAHFREIELCAKLSAPLLVHGGPGAETRGVRETRQRGLDVLERSLVAAQRRAQESGVQLVLENLANHHKPPFFYYGTTAAEILRLLDAARGLLAIVDIGHANVNGGDPVSMFRQLSGRVWALSMSNNAGVHDSHAALDHGTIDFPALRAAFEDTGWVGVVGFETRGADFAANLAFLDALEQAHEARKNARS